MVGRVNRAAARSPESREAIRQYYADRAKKLEDIRLRAGLSVADLAKEMGFKGASSVQRYLSPSYGGAYRPEIARALRNAMLGKGNPPITDDDLAFILASKTLEVTDPMWELVKLSEQLYKNEHFRLLPEHDKDRRRITAKLPLVEGDVSVDMPRVMSKKSIESLKAWVRHLIEFAEDSAALVEKRSEEGPQHKKW